MNTLPTAVPRVSSRSQTLGARFELHIAQLDLQFATMITS